MRLSVSGLAVALGVVWAGSILIVGLVNVMNPSYGQAFLLLADSLYPGYNMNSTLYSVFVATLYGLVDGAVVGLVLAWVYNLVTP